MSGRRRLALGLVGLTLGLVTLASFAIGRGVGDATAQTMAFTTLALAELILVFTLRSTTATAWSLPRNDWLGASVVVSALVVAGAVYLPVGHAVLSTESLAPVELAAALVLAALPALAVEIAKAGMRHAARRP